MSTNWKTEYEQRLRRVAGVTDDTKEVTVRSDNWVERGGGCETCGPSTTAGTEVELCIDGYAVRTFRSEQWDSVDAFSQLMNELFAVELDDEPADK